MTNDSLLLPTLISDADCGNRICFCCGRRSLLLCLLTPLLAPTAAVHSLNRLFLVSFLGLKEILAFIEGFSALKMILCSPVRCPLLSVRALFDRVNQFCTKRTSAQIRTN